MIRARSHHSSEGILFHTLAIFILCFTFVPLTVMGQVRAGLDELIHHTYQELSGKLVGFITNKTSLTSKGEFSAGLFLHQSIFTLKALFTPEHGLMSERKAGVEKNGIESFEGIPVYSLYGTTRKPTKKMLAGITTLVFDIQDIGVRPYTYLSTMIYAMEAAAENKIEFVVLDRPNPLSGERLEGNVLDTTLRSFVGVIPIPYLHGMTLGELAMMAKGERWFHAAKVLKLTVIKMIGWKRSMYWNETGLRWIPPSPNIPTFSSAVGCAMFGAVGELGILSVGIGSDTPFLRIGSKLVQPTGLEQSVISTIPMGISAIRQNFTVPFDDSTKTFAGMKIVLPDNIRNCESLYGSEFRLLAELMLDSVFLQAFKKLPLSTRKMFTKVTGTKRLMDVFDSERGSSLSSVIAAEVWKWKSEAQKFRSKRKKYLLYN